MKKTTRKRRPRKPKAWKEKGFYTPKACIGDECVWLDISSLEPKDCKRLARWLISAADYLESKDTP